MSASARGRTEPYAFGSRSPAYSPGCAGRVTEAESGLWGKPWRSHRQRLPPETAGGGDVVRTASPGAVRVRLAADQTTVPGRADLGRPAPGTGVAPQAGRLEASLLAAGSRRSCGPGVRRLGYPTKYPRARLAADGPVDMADLHHAQWDFRHPTDSQGAARVKGSLVGPRAGDTRGIHDRGRIYHRPTRHLPRARALGHVLHHLTREVLSPAQERHRHR